MDFAGIDPLYPTTPYDKVKAVVGAAHANFDKVKELVNAQPELAKATYDWGFGDWESALGAASHMGRKDIAEYLMERGARPNIFTWAMLGKLNAVKSIIEARPGIQKLHGPHGFTLMDHAQMRLRRENVEGAEKEEQEALVAYLEDLGDANVKTQSLAISEDEQRQYLGKFLFGDGEDEYFKVSVNSRGMLFLGRGDNFGRTLHRVGDHQFAPGGAPSVRVVFQMHQRTATSLVIHDPNPVVEAIKGL